MTWASDIDVDGGVWGSCGVAMVSVAAAFVLSSAEEAFAGSEGDGVFLPEKQEKQEQQQEPLLVIVVPGRLDWKLRMRIGKTKNEEKLKFEN